MPDERREAAPQPSEATLEVMAAAHREHDWNRVTERGMSAALAAAREAGAIVYADEHAQAIELLRKAGGLLGSNAPIQRKKRHERMRVMNDVSEEVRAFLASQEGTERDDRGVCRLPEEKGE